MLLVLFRLWLDTTAASQPIDSSLELNLQGFCCRIWMSGPEIVAHSVEIPANIFLDERQFVVFSLSATQESLQG